MRGGGGIGEGHGGRMKVWDSRAEGGAGGWGRSQDVCPSEAIYSIPSWAILPGPDHHQYHPAISPLFILSSYPGRCRNTFTSKSSHISLFLTLDIFHSLYKKCDKMVLYLRCHMLI